jgi:dihydrofolate reductase
MRNVIVTEFVTLDGVMEAPGGEPTHRHTGWVSDYFDDDIGAYKHQEIVDVEAQMVGRVTYESFAGAWPTYEGPMADRMNSMPKYVASTTLTDPEWTNCTVLQGDVAQAVADLKATAGGDILIPGSKTLVHTLINADLVDELRLMVFPVSIGSGLKVFPETPAKTTYGLAESRSFATGVVLNVYHPVRD